MTKDQQKQYPKVGIFWSVNGVIIGDAVEPEAAETYGEALQHGGHYEYWDNLVPTTGQERKFKSHAYDFYPRGRMVLFPERQTSRLYVDRCMDKDTIQAALHFFGHQVFRGEIEKDEHYQCAGCNRHYME